MGTTAIGWDNYVPNATVTADVSSVAGLDPAQVKNDHGAPEYAFQTAAGILSAVLMIRPANPLLPWRVGGLFRTNLTPQASVVFRWYLNTGALVATATAGGPLAGYRQVIAILSAAITADYLTISISDVNNPDGHLNLPLVYAGPLWIPSYGRTFRSGPGRVNRTDSQQTVGGQKFNKPRWMGRVAMLDFDAIKVSDELWQYAMEVDARARLGGNVLGVPDITSSNLAREAVFGELSTADQLTYTLRAPSRIAWWAKITERL